MAQRKKVLEDLEALNSIKDLAESYEEIAVVRMQKIKDSVLKTRDFLTDLSDVYVDLKSSHAREIRELLAKRQEKNKAISPLLQKKEKTLMVYESSNGRLYGSVTQKVFKLFVKDLREFKDEDVDVVVIGSAGKEMYENMGVSKKFEYFDIPDSNVEIEHIRKLVRKFLEYEKVHVYYGKFNNVIKQNPIATSITGDDIFETENLSETPREDRFIFEPILEKIFHFFETQIMANLFSQTVLENQLARHASRVNAMEEALVHIEEEAKKINQIKNRIKHQTQNRKQLETISGAVLWED